MKILIKNTKTTTKYKHSDAFSFELHFTQLSTFTSGVFCYWCQTWHKLTLPCKQKVFSFLFRCGTTLQTTLCICLWVYLQTKMHLEIYIYIWCVSKLGNIFRSTMAKQIFLLRLVGKKYAVLHQKKRCSFQIKEQTTQKYIGFHLFQKF